MLQIKLYIYDIEQIYTYRRFDNKNRDKYNFMASDLNRF